MEIEFAQIRLDKASDKKRNVWWALAKVYAETHGAMLHLIIMEQTGIIRAFVTYWDPDRLVATNASEAARLIKVPPSSQKYSCVDSRWSARYVHTELGDI